MNSLVSVIIPVYNVEGYIDRCMESILSQTYANIEIILVDDGSPDSCPQKCDDWAERDRRVKVIHKLNGGVSSARNAGLDASTGEFISFVDPDDYLSTDAIEVMLSRMLRDHSDLVVARKMKVYPNGEIVPSENIWIGDTVVSKDDAMHMIGSPQKPFPASLCAKLYRVSIWQNLRFTDLKSGEDACAVPYIIERCTSISVMNAVVYYYYQRDTSAVHTMNYEMQLDGIRAVVQVARFLLDHDYLKEARIFYHSAVCRYIDLRHDREAKQIITGAFSCDERKQLQNWDSDTILSLLAHRFPRIYRIYQLLTQTSHP